MMNKPFASGKGRLVGRGAVYPVPIPLDPAAFVGSLVVGLDPTDQKLKLYFSDGTAWTRSIFDTTISEEIERIIDDLILNGFDEEDLPDPTLPENLRRKVFNNTRGLPAFAWNDVWNYLTDEARVAEIAEDVAADVARLTPPAQVVTLSNTGPEVPGEHYTSINRAIEYLSGFLRNHIPENPQRRRSWLKMLSGYEMDEQAIMQGVDCSHISIVSDDPVVKVRLSELAKNTWVDAQQRAHDAFYVSDGAAPQILGVVFEPDASSVPQDPDVIAVSGAYTPLSRGMYLEGAASASISLRDFDEDGDPISARAAGFRKFDQNYMSQRGTSTSILGGDFDQGYLGGLRIIGAGALRAVTARGCGDQGGLRVEGDVLLINRGSGQDGTFPGVFSQDFRRVEGEDGPTDIILSGGVLRINPSAGNIRGGFSQAVFNGTTPEGTIIWEEQSERSVTTEATQTLTNKTLDDVVITGTPTGSGVTQSPTDTTAGRLMRVGAFGLGDTMNQPNWPNTSLSNISGVGAGIYRSVGSNTDTPDPNLVIWFGSRFADNAQFVQIAVSASAGRMYFRSSNGGTVASPDWSGWRNLWHTGNTTVDSNGFIKEASPIVRLFDDGTQEPVQPVGAQFERLGVGEYRLSGVEPLAETGWQIEVPQDGNGNRLVFVSTEYDASARTLTIITSTPAWDGGWVAGDPKDIPEGRWVDLRFKPLPEWTE